MTDAGATIRRAPPRAPRRSPRPSRGPDPSIPRRSSCPAVSSYRCPAPSRAAANDADVRLGDVDGWGRSEQIRALARRLYDPVYRHWFRAEWEGLEHIPTAGRRAPGRQPRRRDPVRRAGDHARHRDRARPPAVRPRRQPVPVAPGRRHAVVTHRRRARASRQRVPPAARRAAAGARVPRGHEGNGQARRASATSSAGSDAAASSRSPCARACRSIPIAVVGNEEAMPIVWKSPRLAKLLNVPYFPVTANKFVFGPVLGLVVPLPSKFRIRVLPPVYFDVATNQERYNRVRRDGAGGGDPRCDPVRRLRHAARASRRLAGLRRRHAHPRHRARHVLGQPPRASTSNRSPASTSSSASTPVSRGCHSSGPSSSGPTPRTTSSSASCGPRRSTRSCTRT